MLRAGIVLACAAVGTIAVWHVSFETTQRISSDDFSKFVFSVPSDYQKYCGTKIFVYAVKVKATPTSKLIVYSWIKEAKRASTANTELNRLANVEGTSLTEYYEVNSSNLTDHFGEKILARTTTKLAHINYAARADLRISYMLYKDCLLQFTPGIQIEISNFIP